MKIIFRIIFLLSITLAYSDFSNCQTYTTTSKNCGKCGKSVSANSKIGDRCPHCGVIWGRENTSKSKSTYSSPSYPSSSNYSNLPRTSTNKSSAKISTKEREETDYSRASKSETESWILDKLNSYTPKRFYVSVALGDDNLSTSLLNISSGWYMKDFRYSFDDYNLIIIYEEEHKNYTHNYKLEIPVYDIDRVYDYKGHLWIATNKATMNEYNLSENKKVVTSVFKTDFNLYAETELSKRLSKTFLHLKRFYKKPVSTEPF